MKIGLVFFVVLILFGCTTNNHESEQGPVITLNGKAEYTLLQHAEYYEHGATALDRQEGDLTLSITIEGHVNTAIPGRYEIKYSVLDNDQNVSTITRIVNVVINENEVQDVSKLLVDPRLELEVKKILNKDSFTREDLLLIKKLSLFYVHDFNGLQLLKNLESLSLELDSLSQDLGAYQLNDLANLSIYTKQNFDINQITKLTSLESLNINTNGHLNCIEGIENLKNLSFLYLNHNDISNLSPLKELTDLVELQLENNNVHDLSALESISLYKLNLAYNHIQDISSLTHMTHLSDLDISHNEIADLSSLKTLFSLFKLDVSYNQIMDVSSVNALTNLSYLNVSNNKIQEISTINSLHRLRYLNISYNNQIVDVSVLIELSYKGAFTFSTNYEGIILDASFLERNPDIQNVVDCFSKNKVHIIKN